MINGNAETLWQWNGIGAVSIFLFLLGICNLVLSLRQKKRLFFIISLSLSSLDIMI